MKIQENMEYLKTENNLDYYLLSEVGFSNKKYATQNKLYEFFGRSNSSTYYEIFTKKLYDNNLIEQIWVFDKDKVVGLGLAVHFENFKKIMHQDKNLGEILGQIHLYVKPEYRRQGIAKECTQLMESGFLKYDKGFIILQDDALKFKDVIKNFTPISSNFKDDINEVIKAISQQKINLLRQKSEDILLPIVPKRL